MRSACGDRESNLATVVEDRLSLCRQLLHEVGGLERKGLRGVPKLKKLLDSELSFLATFVNEAVEGILHLCHSSSGVDAVKQSFHWQQGLVRNALLVDLVAHGGRLWVKVFARKRQSLQRVWLGEGEPREKSVTQFAKEFLDASDQNVAHFEHPRVAFCFFDGITQSIQDELQKMNVLVIGPVFPDGSAEGAQSPLLSTGGSQAHHGVEVAESVFVVPRITAKECLTVNLDVSSMIAWVSELTHGGHVFTYEDPILEEQAQQEKEHPVWAALQEATQGKELVVCATALRDFVSIVDTVGGWKEQKRARELLSRVRVVKDCTSPRIAAAKLSARIKQRAKVVFGTGDSLQAITLTANQGFVRAVQQQGMSIDACVHSSRALTERASRSEPSPPKT